MFRHIAILTATAPFCSALNIRAGTPPTTISIGPARSPTTLAVSLGIPINELNTDEIKTNLSPEDQWIENLDYDAFARDVTALGKELVKETGEEDVVHLRKIVGWRNVAALVGLASVWITPNPLTIVALSTWNYASWTMIAHHTCHGGYNRVDAGRFNSRAFGLGFFNRLVDWLDWMQPEAWNIEHNRMHHYRLNESKDPDFVQRNLNFLRHGGFPEPLRYLTVLFFLTIWKWFYYAPNTYKELKINEWTKSGKKLPDGMDPEETTTIVSLFDPTRGALQEVVKPREVFLKVLGPLFFSRYIMIPALLYSMPEDGATLATHAVVNLVLSELLTNVHAFVTIVTNHAGEDLYTFDDTVKPKTGSFYVRQVIGSANYDSGTDLIDFFHGWLNYQIEHHVWPDLSMLQYQRAAPRLKAICKKHGVPYVQENVFERLRKTVDIMVGRTSMRTFPTEFEPTRDKAGASGVTWKYTNGDIDDE